MLDQNDPRVQSAVPWFCDSHKLACLVDQSDPKGR